MALASIRKIEQALESIRAALPLAPETCTLEGRVLNGNVCGVCNWFDSHADGCFVGTIESIITELDEE